MPQNTEGLVILVFSFGLLIMSIVAHEVAHGWVAWRCGDPTAKMMGRLTLNPVPHIDPMMSVILPLIMYVTTHTSFGAAKPVPVNERNLRRYPRDLILVALAGVTTNLLIAVACSGLIHAGNAVRGEFAWSVAGRILARTAFLNLSLCVFNLIPIPPLDGSRVFRFILQGEMRAKYMEMERYGFMILLVLLWVPAFGDLIYTGIATLAHLIGIYEFM